MIDRRTVHEAQDRNLPRVAVVLPIRNEEPCIARALQQIFDQDYPSGLVDVIVVDGQSTDQTCLVVRELQKQHANLRLLNNAKRRSSAARNIGAKSTDAEYVVYIDGHCQIPSKRLLSDMVELFRSKSVLVLSRPQLLEPSDNSVFQNMVAWARASGFGHGSDSTIYSLEEKFVDPTSSGAMYHRSVFEKVGYFDEVFDACEDVEFNFRLSRTGIRSFTSPKLLVYYYPRENFLKLFRQLARYGCGRFLFLHKHPGAVSVNQLIPPLFVLGLPLLFLIGSVISVLAVFPEIIFGLYAAANLAFSGMEAFKHKRPKSLFVLSMIYLTIHVGLGYGFWQGFFRRMTGKRSAY